MDQRAQKLTRLLKDQDLAEDLVAAGLDTPKKIKAATDKAVEKAVGVFKKSAVRKKFK